MALHTTVELSAPIVDWTALL